MQRRRRIKNARLDQKPNKLILCEGCVDECKCIPLTPQLSCTLMKIDENNRDIVPLLNF